MKYLKLIKEIHPLVKYPIGTILDEYKWCEIIGRKGNYICIDEGSSDLEYWELVPEYDKLFKLLDELYETAYLHGYKDDPTDKEKEIYSIINIYFNETL